MLDTLNNSTSPAPGAAAPTAADNAGLSARAMLAVLNISVWTARKHDRRVTVEVTESHNAAADAGRWNKALLAKSALSDIAQCSGEARAFLYGLTLPWMDEGTRILPTAAFFQFRDGLKKRKEKFDSLVDAFIVNYPTFIEKARTDLGVMFDASDYPEVHEIRRKFGFEHRIWPMPDSRDFRVDLSDAQIADLRAEVEESSKTALDVAMRDVWTRIADVVEKIADKLQAYKPATDTSKAEGVFRDSLIENARDLAAILPALNLTNDSWLADITERLTKELCAYDAKELRESDAIRSTTAKAAEKILSEVRDFLA